MKSIVAGLALLLTLSCITPSFAQLGFGSNKQKKGPILDFSKNTKSSFSLLDWNGSDSSLTFDNPGNAIQRLNANTQRAFNQTTQAIAKPFQDLKRVRIWPASQNRRSSNESFQILPNWLRPSGNQQAEQPATIADFLAQPRPE